MPRRRHGTALLGRALFLVGLGVVIGPGGALGLGRAIASLLYGVGAGDPLTFALVGVGLTIVGAAAAYLPVRRALAIDPARALRADG